MERVASFLSRACEISGLCSLGASLRNARCGTQCRLPCLRFLSALQGLAPKYRAETHRAVKTFRQQKQGIVKPLVGSGEGGSSAMCAHVACSKTSARYLQLAPGDEALTAVMVRS